jgi:hypothetical protein
VTFRVTVFEVALPFLGITVTVTLQEPAFNPLSVVPDTLQNFEELGTTFSDSFEVENTLSLANVAIDFADADLEAVNLGEVKAGTSKGATAGAYTGATTGVSDASALVTVTVYTVSDTPS